MTQKLSQIFKEMSEIDPPKELGSLIMQKISLKKEKQLKRKMFISYVGIFGSVIAIAYSLAIFGQSFVESEFWKIFSLAFSDFMVVATSWRIFLYSLGETLPVAYIIGMLVPIFGVLAFSNLLISLRNEEHSAKRITRHIFQN